MSSTDFLIVTVYCIIVSYVFYLANKSLDDQVTIEPDYTSIKDELKKYNLNGLVDIKFKFRPSYRLIALTKLPISIQNTSQDETIRVEWDECAITDFDNITGRVIKLAPGMTDIPQKQAVSIIVPGRILQEELSDDKSLTGALFKAEKLKRATEKPSPFYLRLLLKITSPTSGDRSCPLRCKFLPRKLSWTKAYSIALKPR